MTQSAAFGIMHLGIGFAVGHAPSGSVAIAGAVTGVEPVVNTVAQQFSDR